MDNINDLILKSCLEHCLRKKYLNYTVDEFCSVLSNTNRDEIVASVKKANVLFKRSETAHITIFIAVNFIFILT